MASQNTPFQKLGYVPDTGGSDFFVSPIEREPRGSADISNPLCVTVVRKLHTKVGQMDGAAKSLLPCDSRKGRQSKQRSFGERGIAGQQADLVLWACQFFENHCISPGASPWQDVRDGFFEDHRMLVKRFLACGQPPLHVGT